MKSNLLILIFSLSSLFCLSQVATGTTTSNPFTNILKARTFTDFPLSGTNGVIDTGWRNWNAGITPYEIHLNGSVSSGSSLSIQSAYLLIKSR